MTTRSSKPREAESGRPEAPAGRESDVLPRPRRDRGASRWIVIILTLCSRGSSQEHLLFRNGPALHSAGIRNSPPRATLAAGSWGGDRAVPCLWTSPSPIYPRYRGEVGLDPPAPRLVGEQPLFGIEPQQVILVTALVQQLRRQAQSREACGLSCSSSRSITAIQALVIVSW